MDFRLLLRAPWRRSNMCLRKGRPGRTTLHAWFRWPTSDWISLAEHTFLSPHWVSNAPSRSSFSFGSIRVPLMVSISTPRKTRHVVGPSLLWAAIGTPSLPHTLSRVSRASWHSCVSGLPNRMKSSRYCSQYLIDPLLPKGPLQCVCDGIKDLWG